MKTSSWNRTRTRFLGGVEIVLFNPIKAIDTPKAPIIIEPLGSLYLIITRALKSTRGSLALISPIFDP
jgi:hypothetical protein